MANYKLEAFLGIFIIIGLLRVSYHHIFLFSYFIVSLVFLIIMGFIDEYSLPGAYVPGLLILLSLSFPIILVSYLIELFNGDKGGVEISDKNEM